MYGQRSRECEISRYRHGCDPPKPHGQSQRCFTSTLQSLDLSGILDLDPALHRSLSCCLTIALISFLCLGVFLQMLGVPISFWNLHWSDAVNATLLCGFAVITNESFLPLQCSALLALLWLALGYFYQGQNVPFRPPISSH